MFLKKGILSITAVLALGALSAFAGQTARSAAATSSVKTTGSKVSKPNTYTAQGSIVAATDEMVTLRLRSGKKDMSFKISSTTQKPTSMTPGSNVTVSYHDVGNQHIASAIQLAPTKSNATAVKPSAGK